jgi:hypothetical protein
VQSSGRNDAAKRIASGLLNDSEFKSETTKKGMGIMSRALGIAKMIGSLLAIELFVPGGTLIVLTLLLTGRPGSPLQQSIARRFPAMFRLVSGLVGNVSTVGPAVGQS